MNYVRQFKIFVVFVSLWITVWLIGRGNFSLQNNGHLTAKNLKCVAVSNIPDLPNNTKHINDFARKRFSDVQHGKVSLRTEESKEVIFIDSTMLSNISLLADIDERIDSFDKVRIPHFPFLENYKNPCWYEVLPDNYRKSYGTVGLWYDQRMNPYRERMIKFFDERLQKGSEFKWRLRCLPLIQIIGVEKSGTSELFKRLIKHKEILPGSNKELQFWGSCGLASNLTFSHYISFLDEAAEFIRKSHIAKVKNGRQVEYHQMMAIEASPRTWISTGGNIPNKENQARQSVEYLVAHQLKNIVPGFDTKIIMIVRNPIDRLFSGYKFFGKVFGKPLSAQDFHDRVTKDVTEFNQCLESQPLDYCTFRPINDLLYHVRINRGIYYASVKHWIKLFPDMKVVRMEDLKGDAGKMLMMKLFKYLGVTPLKSLNVAKVSNKGPNVEFKMYNRTRELLYEFYQPYNKLLADLLHDDAFSYANI